MVNVTFLCIKGRTVGSVTRLVGFVEGVEVVGRFDENVGGGFAVVGLRDVVIGLDVVVVNRTAFFVVDEVSFSS